MQKRFFILLMFVVSLAACGKPEKPVYLGYENFRLEKMSLQENTVAVDLKLYNPNRYALQLKKADVDVALNNKHLGHSSIDSLIVLPAQDTSAVPLRLRASAEDLLKHSARLLLNPEVKVSLTGNAKVGRNGFFIDLPVNYEGMQHLDNLFRDTASKR